MSLRTDRPPAILADAARESQPPASSEPRRVALLAFPEVQSLDVIGPLEVFSSATRLLLREPGQRPGYQIELLSSSGDRPLHMSCGVSLLARGFRRPLLPRPTR